MKLPALKLQRKRGFTLIELLVVIGILAVLLAIVLVAINPARQFAQANDTKRSADVNAILNAIHQYAVDNGGQPPQGLANPDTDYILNIATLPDFCTDLVPTYIAALPVDPLTNNGTPVTDCATVGWNTNYTISRSGTDNRITVTATATETGDDPDDDISVTR